MRVYQRYGEADTCQLCEKRKGKLHIGGVVSFICYDCETILANYYKFANKKKIFHKQATNLIKKMQKVGEYDGGYNEKTN